MKPKHIIAALRAIALVMFYLVSAVAILFIATSVWNILHPGREQVHIMPDSLQFEVMGFGDNRPPAPAYVYPADSVVRYRPNPDRYNLQVVKPASTLGYYAVTVSLIGFGLFLTGLWLFIKVCDRLKPERPFRGDVARYLKLLAGLFILSDVAALVHYLLFGHLVHLVAGGMKVELLIGIGRNTVVGLVTWIIAVVFERGVELQSESDLTV